MSMMMSETVSNKISKVSFLGALMVVALHVGIGPKWVGQVVALKGMAVPLFFVVSGYLFAGRMREPGWYVRQMRSRSRSLLLPYLFWNAAYWCFVVGLTVALGAIGVKYGAMDTLDGLMWRRWDLFGLNPLAFPALGLLWFVRSLMALVLISPVFSVFYRRWSWILLLICFVGAFVFACANPEPKNAWVSIWLTKGWICAVVYFGAGVWIRFHGGEDLRVPRPLAVLILVTGWCFLAGSDEMLKNIGTVTSIWGLWYTVSGSAWPLWLTSCSFPIYVLHVFWGVFVAALFSACGLKSWAMDSALGWLLKYGIMVVGSLGGGLLLRRMMPKLGHCVFGGR